MKVIQNIVPTAEPVTIAVKETVSREELRLSRVRKNGREMIDIRLWDISEDGTATPHHGGYTIGTQDAARLRDALNEIL